MNKTLVIFDIDGTLLNSNRIDSRCFAETYVSIYNTALPSIDWREYPHVTDHTIFTTVFEKQFGRKPGEEEVGRFKDAFVVLMRQKRQLQPVAFEPVPGARAVIPYLRSKQQYEVGIATGSWEAPAQVKLAHVGIDPAPLYDSYADGQPTREAIVQAAIDKAKQSTGNIGRVVYVGDAIWDVETTRNMSLPFIGLRLKGDFSVLTDQGVRHVLKDYENLDLFEEYVQTAPPPP